MALLVMISGCSASSGDMAGEAGDAKWITHEGQAESADTAIERSSAIREEEAAEAEAGSMDGDPERKIIREQYLHLDVQDLDQTLERVEKLVNRISGAYIESVEQWEVETPHRQAEYHAHVILRLPVGQAVSLLQEIETYGNVLRRSVHGQDVTVEYVDNESRLRNLTKHEERLLSLYDQAETIEDMLKLEKELSRIREQIETIQGRQQYLDRVTSTVRVTLDIRQVEEKEYLGAQDNKSVWHEAWAGLKQSVHNIGRLAQRGFVLLVTLIPYLIIVAVLGLPGYMLTTRLYRKRKTRGD